MKPTSIEAAHEQLSAMDYAKAEQHMRAAVGVALDKVPSEVLLQVLAQRGGHPGALAEAALLAMRKSADYDKGSAGYGDPHKVDRSAYFPFGAVSYAQMLHTKSQRFNSLVKKSEAANFEGLRDTALDIINYAGFYIASLEKEGKA